MNVKIELLQHLIKNVVQQITSDDNTHKLIENICSYRQTLFKFIDTVESCRYRGTDFVREVDKTGFRIDPNDYCGTINFTGDDDYKLEFFTSTNIDTDGCHIIMTVNIRDTNDTGKVSEFYNGEISRSEIEYLFGEFSAEENNQKDLFVLKTCISALLKQGYSAEYISDKSLELSYEESDGDITSSFIFTYDDSRVKMYSHGNEKEYESFTISKKTFDSLLNQRK